MKKKQKSFKVMFEAKVSEVPFKDTGSEKELKVSQKASSRFKITITVSWKRFNIENRTSFQKKGDEEKQSHQGQIQGQ